MIIDFTKKEEILTEGWLKMFGSWNKMLLKRMYGNDAKMMATLPGFGDAIKLREEDGEVDNSVKFVVRGEQRDLKTYADALFAEKKYLDMYLQYGEDHLQTRKAKEVLRQAVSKFETQTNITWPFTDEG
tara:strand:- start:236 stop:622 length:387 start_codon:yes stop_codon:yes gene_type:complete